MEVARTLWCPKEGSTDEQYEDAYCIGEGRVALADGASAAVFARQWAQLLTEDFATGAPFPESDDGFWERVAPLSEQWQVQVGDGGGSWWAEEKVPQGSAASLLVVDLSQPGRWSAQAVGDVCCFAIRAGKLKYAFPLTKAAAFGNHPALVPTRPERLQKKPPVVRFSASIEPGDRLFLCTDAIAHWFLARHEKRARPWDELPSDEAFGAWVQARRDDDTLKNDDVTLLELQF